MSLHYIYTCIFLGVVVTLLNYHSVIIISQLVLEMKSWVLLSVLVLAANMLQQYCVDGQQAQVPCLFAFGGTLSDHGNNNNLRTRAKSNYGPYGINFPRGSTGRFTNGKTQVDFIGT